MRRLMLILALLVLSACTFQVQVLPQANAQTETPIPKPTTEANVAANGQMLAGPDINYNEIRFTLDPALGSRLYVFDDVIALDGAEAHYLRFALTPEDYCQTWCVMVYHVADFEQAFGMFVFPPLGYRGGAAVIFEAQKQALSFQNGSGERGLEAFGQSHFGVSNKSLKYVFRGYSADKEYGIYVQVSTHAANLPDVAPTLAFNSQDVLDFNQKATESMNLLTPADFTPNLSLLDALVASIHVEIP